jgi:DNA-binding transcriptional LysR family regulator
VDQGQLLVDAARSGCGIAQVFTFMVRELLEAGALVAVLTEFAPQGPPLHALFKPGHQDDAKVRAFVDFMVEKFRAPLAL